MTPDTTLPVPLPCPFCGNDKNITVQNERHDHSGGYFISCPECMASTGLRFACGDDPRPLLLEQWNARACMAPLQERADALEAALKELNAAVDWLPNAGRNAGSAYEAALDRIDAKNRLANAQRAANALINPTGGES